MNKSKNTDPSLPTLGAGLSKIDEKLGPGLAKLEEIEITDVPKMKRYTKLTPELQDRICKVLAAGCTRSAAISYAGIVRDTFYRWLNKKRSNTFKPAVLEAEAKARVAHESALAILGVEGKDRLALKYWLENRYGEDWKNVANLNVSGDLNVKIVDDISK